MWGSRRHGVVVAVGLTAGLLVGGCASDAKPKSGITIDTLAAASGTACPVPLEVAADNSGVDTPSPATGSVVVGQAGDTSAGASSQPMSAIDAADGVTVSCALTLADGSSLDLVLVAARTDAAPELVVPAAQLAGGLTKNQATQLLNDALRTEDAELVAVPGSEAVAMMRTSVDGANSAALVVSSGTLRRAQVEQVARQLDQRMH